MVEPANESGGITGDLEEIVRRGRHVLRAWAAKEALGKAFVHLFRAALVVPCLALIGNLIGLVGPSLWPFATVTTVVLAVVAPFVIVAVHALVVVLREKTDRRVCLTLFDKLLDLKGRLQAADEFLSRGPVGPFEHAAVEDAGPFARQALEAELPAVRTPPPTLKARRWPLGAVSMLVLGAALLLGEAPSLAVDTPVALVDEVPTELVALVNTATEEESEPPLPKESSRRSLDGRRTAAVSEPGSEGDRAALSQTGTSDTRSSFAKSSSAASLARQAGKAAVGASGEGSSKKAEPRERPAKPRRENPSRPEEATEEEPEISKGVSGGTGRSSGSRTSSSDQPPAHDKARNDEAESDATDDAEDEEDGEQKGASSSKPMLNNREPAVDRSLSPSSLSDRENKATGRSGRSGLKKTRGVAAMLLGVPMPDHLRGKSNPGRIKVERERADPEPKTSPATDATNRGSRRESIGYLPHLALAPWMQDTVRNYFLAQRARNLAESDSTPSTTN